MEYGFSRQLIVDALNKMDEMGDEKEQREFLRQSGFEKFKNRMLGSMSLKDFLIFAEERTVESEQGELRWVDAFIANIDSSKVGFIERVNAKALPYEMSPYEQRQLKLK